MIIVDITEKYVSQSEINIITSKVNTYSINSPSVLSSCSICATYDRFYHDQNKRIMLKSYIPGVDLWIGVKRCYKKCFTEKLSMYYMIGWITILV